MQTIPTKLKMFPLLHNIKGPHHLNPRTRLVELHDSFSHLSISNKLSIKDMATSNMATEIEGEEQKPGLVTDRVAEELMRYIFLLISNFI
jgi:hypothetical protein